MPLTQITLFAVSRQGAHTIEDFDGRTDGIWQGGFQSRNNHIFCRILEQCVKDGLGNEVLGKHLYHLTLIYGWVEVVL